MPASSLIATHELRVTYIGPLTRQQGRIYRLLEAGWVAEMMKPLHQPVSRRYIMRGPAATETDGAVVTAKTIEALLDRGLAIRVKMPWNDKTWVYSRTRYERSPMGKATSESPSLPPPASDASSTPSPPQTSSRS